ncbi:unnamed protein product [Orchesella dallaii]|uniref:F-box domain-containing protein n=1 Tax=Orchesella dallaii TaxID=48710 RepID=A0ABP1PTW3_9HEXA
MENAGVGYSQSQGHVSQTHIFEILPEIWDSILPHLSPTDFQSLKNSCRKYSLMFESQTASQLLPLILQILFNHYDFLPPQFLLIFRCVNRQLKEFIDTNILEETPEKYYQNLTTLKREWSPRINDKRNLLRNRVEWLKRRYEFNSTSEIQEFTTTYSQLQCDTPFLTKSLLIIIGDSTQMLPNEQNLNDYSTTMFEKLGTRVSAVTLDGVLPINAVHLFTLLNLLPNLKVLKIRGVLSPGQYEDVKRCEEGIEIKHLELLDVEMATDYGSNGMGIVCAALLKCRAFQLKRLICCRGLFQNVATTRALLTYNGNLQKLKFLLVTRVNNEGLARIFTTLSQMNNLPELEMIELSGRVLEDRVSFNGFLKILNKFSASLNQLQLNLDVRTVYDFEGGRYTEAEENGPTFDKLTKIGTLLSNIDKLCFRRWVQGKCENLRELSLFKEGKEGLDEVEEARIKGMFEVAPKLKKILVSKGFGNSMFEPEQSVFGRDGSVRKFRFKWSP